MARISDYYYPDTQLVRGVSIRSSSGDKTGYYSFYCYSGKSRSKAQLCCFYRIGNGPPLMEANQVIYFYSQAETPTPVDSLIFRTGPHHLILDESSSSMSPETMKLDYQLCYFLAKKETSDRLEVVINKQTSQTAWVEKEFMDLLPWPVFLTNVHSVEPKDWSKNPLRMSPEDKAKVVPGIGKDHILQAKSVSDDWLSVEIFDGNYQAISKGWIRWRRDGILLLDYNLLS